MVQPIRAKGKAQLLVVAPGAHGADHVQLRAASLTGNSARPLHQLPAQPQMLSVLIRCVQAGLYESPVVPHRDTLRCAELFDRILQTRL